MAETSEQTQPEAPQAPVLAAPASVNGELSSSPSTSATPEGEAGESEPQSQASQGSRPEPDAVDPSASDATRAEATPLAAQREADVGEADVGEDEGEEGGADEPANAADEAAGAASGDPTKAKRKRRRRRKRKDGTSSGEVTAAGEGAEALAPRSPDSSKKKESHAPFAHFFTGGHTAGLGGPTGQGGKRHAFAVGEVVTGRVQRVDYGVIVVDLFGKAIAIADEYEPRDVPPLPAPPVEHAEPAAPAADAATVAGDVAAPTDLATTLTGEPTPSGIETMSQPPAEPPVPAESTASGSEAAPLTAAAPEA